MISRLILVGMVGVLGVSLPDGAGWEIRLTWARTGATACAGRRAAVAFEPIAVDDNPINQIADELNRRSEGLDIPTEPIARVATIARPVVAESDQAVESLFAENRVWGEPAAEAVASDISPAQERRPGFEPIAVVGDTSNIADELNRASEGIDIDPATATVRTSRRPNFEPIAAANEAWSVADDLNRASEGLPTVQDAEPSIETAMGLTRDAALAWMNVLTKTMTAPSHSR